MYVDIYYVCFVCTQILFITNERSFISFLSLRMLFSFGWWFDTYNPIYICIYIYAYTHITLTTTWNLERNENRTELDSKSCHKHFAQKYIHDFSASTFNDFFIIDLRFFFCFWFSFNNFWLSQLWRFLLGFLQD